MTTIAHHAMLPVLGPLSTENENVEFWSLKKLAAQNMEDGNMMILKGEN